MSSVMMSNLWLPSKMQCIPSASNIYTCLLIDAHFCEQYIRSTVVMLKKDVQGWTHDLIASMTSSPLHYYTRHGQQTSMQHVTNNITTTKPLLHKNSLIWFINWRILQLMLTVGMKNDIGNANHRSQVQFPPGQCCTATLDTQSHTPMCLCHQTV